MKLIYLIPLLLCSCVQGTTVWEGGQKVLATNGDFAGLNFQSGHTTLQAVTVTHSALITARGAAFSQVIMASGAAVGQGAAVFNKKP